MLDEFEIEDHRHIGEIRRRDRRLIRDAFAPRDQEPEPEQEYRNPNQPACTAGANGALAARRAMEIAQERMEKK